MKLTPLEWLNRRKAKREVPKEEKKLNKKQKEKQVNNKK